VIATVYAHGSKNRINFRRSDSAIYSSVSLVWSGASERQFCACKGNLKRAPRKHLVPGSRLVLWKTSNEAGFEALHQATFQTFQALPIVRLELNASPVRVHKA